ncbi:hypothetical protein QCE63_11085 [Caballeronia sp. LZ065]|uniref:protein YgfX n=1 Tax=Caballeronia sp. LZ065 TaxID=3038571 RepID=UPI00285AE8D5|nr:protein YgfX [Caballeronia sp. LZ065]MDR5779963.1 hypothetical protein [Caballeronia sp. LZ065]
MTSARVIRPHRETGFAPGIPLRPSRFLLAAHAGCLAVACGAVFQCVFAHTGHAGHAAVACALTAALLGLASYRWMRAQPKALHLHADGLTLQRPGGILCHVRIVRCAQWGGWLLALRWTSAHRKAGTLLVAADSIDAETLRQLAVQARRSAASHL